MLQTIIISAIFGLLGGISATYFRSLFHIKEKKFELIFDYRKEIYTHLHKLTFLTDSFANARYDWQIGGTDNAQVWFEKKFQQWFKKLKDFYETTSWVIDESVYEELEKLYKIAEDMDIKFWSEKEEFLKIDMKEIDELWFKLLKAGEDVRIAIRQDMRMDRIYRHTFLSHRSKNR